MSFDYLELACSPLDEECVQVTDREDYIPAMQKEVLRFKEQLGRLFPTPADLEGQVRFVVKKNSHDFGMYMEVAIQYNSNNEKAEAFAFYVENNLPLTWNQTEVKESFEDFLKES